MIELDHPNRCQGITTNGQCCKLAQISSKYCRRHGTHRDMEEERDKNLYYFLKAEDRARVDGLKQPDTYKSLRNELAIVRLLIERQINLRFSRPDLLTVYGPLNSLLLTSDQLVQDLNQLEVNLDALLSKPTLLSFSSNLLTIITEELEDIPESQILLNEIGSQFVLIVGNAGIELSKNCLQSIEQSGKPLYNLLNPEYQLRFTSLFEHEDAKHLREELAIARMLLEERFNAIHSDSDFLAACGTLNSQLLTVAKLVKTIHKLEQKLGTLLTKPTTLSVGNKLVGVLIEKLSNLPDYEARIDRISSRIIETISKI